MGVTMTSLGWHWQCLQGQCATYIILTLVQDLKARIEVRKNFIDARCYLVQVRMHTETETPEHT